MIDLAENTARCTDLDDLGTAAELLARCEETRRDAVTNLPKTETTILEGVYEIEGKSMDICMPTGRGQD